MKNKKFSFCHATEHWWEKLRFVYLVFSKTCPLSPETLEDPTVWASDQGPPPSPGLPSPWHSEGTGRQPSPSWGRSAFWGCQPSAERLPSVSAGHFNSPSEPSWCPLIGSKIQGWIVTSTLRLKTVKYWQFPMRQTLILFRTVSEMWCYYQNLLFREVIISIVF